MGVIMKKPANTKKPMITICSKQRGPTGGSGAAGHRSPRRVNTSTGTGDFAADLLQVQPSATIDSINDCRLRSTDGAALDSPARG
jgi:hypothetical protein